MIERNLLHYFKQQIFFALITVLVQSYVSEICVLLLRVTCYLRNVFVTPTKT
jgi:hypothetical protein